MKDLKMKKCLILVYASSVLVFLGGCASEKLVARYTVPAAAVKTSNLSDISPLSIVVSAKLYGNIAVNPAAIESSVKQQVASRLYQEGELKSTDIIWGNLQGGNMVSSTFRKYNSTHGYARYVTDEHKGGTLFLDITAALNNNLVKETTTFELKRLPYNRKDKEKEKPTSVPDYERIQKEKVDVEYDILQTEGKGILKARMIDKHGAEIYKKSFPLGFSRKNSLQVHEAPMTANDIFAYMVARPIESLVTEISPHQESRALQVNDKGCEQGILLLQAHAYAEAATFLENIEPKTPADWENLGLAYEILGDYTLAREAYTQGACPARINALDALEKKRLASEKERSK
jgi:hypothetical protein